MLSNRGNFRHGEQIFKVCDNAFSFQFFLGRFGVHRRGTRGSDIFQHLLFVRRVTLDRFHQIGNQVMPALQLHVNVGPRFLGAVFERHQAIIIENQPDKKRGRR